MSGTQARCAKKNNVIFMNGEKYLKKAGFNMPEFTYYKKAGFEYYVIGDEIYHEVLGKGIITDIGIGTLAAVFNGQYELVQLKQTESINEFLDKKSKKVNKLITNFKKVRFNTFHSRQVYFLICQLELPKLLDLLIHEFDSTAIHDMFNLLFQVKEVFTDSIKGTQVNELNLAEVKKVFTETFQNTEVEECFNLIQELNLHQAKEKFFQFMKYQKQVESLFNLFMVNIQGTQLENVLNVMKQCNLIALNQWLSDNIELKEKVMELLTLIKKLGDSELREEILKVLSNFLYLICTAINNKHEIKFSRLDKFFLVNRKKKPTLTNKIKAFFKTWSFLVMHNIRTLFAKKEIMSSKNEDDDVWEKVSKMISVRDPNILKESDESLIEFLQNEKNEDLLKKITSVLLDYKRIQFNENDVLDVIKKYRCKLG